MDVIHRHHSIWEVVCPSTGRVHLQGTQRECNDWVSDYYHRTEAEKWVEPQEDLSHIDKLKEMWVVDRDEEHTWRCQELLRKLYDCQEDMERLLDGGKEDKHYFLMEILIKRLELHIANQQDLK